MSVHALMSQTPRSVTYFAQLDRVSKPQAHVSHPDRRRARELRRVRQGSALHTYSKRICPAALLKSSEKNGSISRESPVSASLKAICSPERPYSSSAARNNM